MNRRYTTATIFILVAAACAAPAREQEDAPLLWAAPAAARHYVADRPNDLSMWRAVYKHASLPEECAESVARDVPVYDVSVDRVPELWGDGGEHLRGFFRHRGGFPHIVRGMTGDAFKDSLTLVHELGHAAEDCATQSPGDHLRGSITCRAQSAFAPDSLQADGSCSTL